MPDTILGFDFHEACRMHDLGYDLLRVDWAESAAKQRIDNTFRDALLEGTCLPEPWLRRLACTAIATVMWAAASLAPTPHTPDPRP